MDHILNSCENRKKGTLRAKEAKQGHSYLYAWFTRMRTRKGEEKKYNEINITKKIGFQRSDDINWRTESWMIYLYSKLDDVKRERVVFSTTCLRSRRSRAQLRQCVVLLSVKNNVTKRGKKSHL